MAATGLTRGGFYGHFRSKTALFAEALAGEHDFVERLRARRATSREGLLEEQLAVVRDYLAPDHRERVARGCSLAALSADVARAPVAARRSYTRALRQLSAELGRGLEKPLPDGEDPRALAAVALCVGGLLLSRAVSEPELADRISEACRAGAERELRRPR